MQKAKRIISARIAATEPTEVIAKSLPFDAETEAQLEKITLLGQDRDALYEFIGRVAALAITDFGRSCLSDLRKRELPVGRPIDD
jgi:hypothetical protein